MKKEQIQITKTTGEKVDFSLEKLRASLLRSGADNRLIKKIIKTVQDELYDGITSKEIYNRAFAMLKRKESIFASKYKLKRAIFELGPTGFPFERFVGAVLEYSGYEVDIGTVLNGRCVKHEVDVVARKNSDYIVAECKFNSDESRNCDVKVPLYIDSRFRDIVNRELDDPPTECWVVTNTRFTRDAIDYGLCSGLYLLSWDHPKGNSLRERIDRLGLYPITVSTLLTKREKQFLLSRDIVLCRQLYKDDFYLDHLGISDSRKKRIMDEVNMLCNL